MNPISPTQTARVRTHGSKGCNNRKQVGPAWWGALWQLATSSETTRLRSTRNAPATKFKTINHPSEQVPRETSGALMTAHTQNSTASRAKTAQACESVRITNPNCKPRGRSSSPPSRGTCCSLSFRTPLHFVVVALCQGCEVEVRRSIGSTKRIDIIAILILKKIFRPTAWQVRGRQFD